jgi:hypothetical protein
MVYYALSTVSTPRRRLTPSQTIQQVLIGFTYAYLLAHLPIINRAALDSLDPSTQLSTLAWLFPEDSQIRCIRLSR